MAATAKKSYIPMKKQILLILLCAFFTLLISFFRIPDGDINYYNSDATWHVLWTMQAYKETPVSIHKFLPIVSMGEPEDKWISCAATIPDIYGNYYYTSFSAAGFTLPYLFIRLFGLPIAESSLYVFNCLLFYLSAVVFGLFVMELFHNKKYSLPIALFAVLLYLTPPQMLHGMGIVYWHQSLMQLTLILQLYSYYYYVEKSSKISHGIFLALCLINPYIEWTGYVANIGYALYEGFRNRKKTLLALKSFFKIILLTALSFALFTCHYLLAVEPDAYWAALRARFFARSVSSSSQIKSLLMGYVDSFKPLWVLLIFLSFLSLFCCHGLPKKQDSVLASKKWVLFLAVWPVFENVIMMGHAITYTYDRMKMVFPLVLVICDFISIIWKYLRPVFGGILLGGSILFVSLWGVNSYIGNEAFIWAAPYREDCRLLASYALPLEKDSVMGCTSYTGRCIYLDFQRGVYQFADMESMISKAQDTGKRYALLLEFGDNANSSWGMPIYDNLKVYDLSTGTLSVVRVVDGALTISEN